MKVLTASAWTALAAGVVSAALISLALALPAPAVQRTPVFPAVPPSSGASAELQRQLNMLLADVVGPDRAVAVADVVLDQRRSSETSLTYGKRGTALASSVGNTRATGYRHRTTSAAWGHNQKVVH